MGQAGGRRQEEEAGGGERGGVCLANQDAAWVGVGSALGAIRTAQSLSRGLLRRVGCLSFERWFSWDAA